MKQIFELYNILLVLIAFFSSFFFLSFFIANLGRKFEEECGKKRKKNR